MKIEETIPYLLKDKKIHVVVHHENSEPLIREFYVETSSHGKFMLFDKKTHKRLDDPSSESYNEKYAIGVAFIQGNWEIYEEEDDWKLKKNTRFDGYEFYTIDEIKLFIQKVKKDIDRVCTSDGKITFEYGSNLNSTLNGIINKRAGDL